MKRRLVDTLDRAGEAIPPSLVEAVGRRFDHEMCRASVQQESNLIVNQSYMVLVDWVVSCKLAVTALAAGWSLFSLIGQRSPSCLSRSSNPCSCSWPWANLMCCVLMTFSSLSTTTTKTASKRVNAKIRGREEEW